MRTTQTFKDNRACPQAAQPGQNKKCNPKITTANFARPGNQTKFSATALASTKNVLAQKWRNTKLATTTTRSQRKRSCSFILMAIPRDHRRPRQVPKDLPARKRTLGLLDRRRWRLRLRRFVADQAHFAKEFRYLHAGERFEERGYLSGNPGDVAGQLVRAGGIAITRGNDGHFVYLAERLAECSHHFR